MRRNILSIFKRSKALESKITLWLNHLLVLYSLLIPIHNKSKSSIFFIMILLFLYRGRYWYYIKSTLSNKVVQAFLAFYVISLVGFLYTENIEFAKSTMNKVKYIIFPLFFLTFLDQRFTIRIITAFSIGVFCSELLSYAIRLEIVPIEFYFFNYEVYSTSLHDPSPFFNHLDHNIGLAVIVSLLLFQLLNYNLSRISKIFTIIFMVSATINMSFIGSRTGYILYLVLIVTVLMITYKENLKKALLFILLLLIPICYLTYNNSEMVKKRVHNTMDSIEKIIENKDYNNSLGKRLGLAYYGLEVIKDNPLIGVGTGDYMDEIRFRIPEEHNYLKNLSEPHNVYIKTLVQFGIVGLLSLLYIFYTLVTYRNTSITHKGMIVTLSVAMLLIMLPGKFYGFFVLPMFITLVSALIVEEKREINFSSFSLKTGITYFLLAILFLIIGITK